ncbi:MAG: DNA primase [Sphingobacteriales bacterium]|nr:DNA primase [Sphingobacteriales bacterium]
MISNTTKEQILDSARIEEVVGDFVVLRKRGANLLGLCPFHNERTPSFTVSPAKGFFKCFGCGKAGDSATFVMEHEHLTFPEALRWLATKYNITIEEEAPSAEQAEQDSLRENLFTVTGFAQDFFEDALWNSDEGRSVGLSYFRERGFSDQTIRKFKLGYAFEKWDALTAAASERGFQPELLEKTGLTIAQENRRYDRFRARVVFPIHNLTGRPVGFGARILKSDPKSPKYLNSPETEIYFKSKNLYGIAHAKKAIIALDACYLVEGYTDVVSLHQAGVENVVASSGTALTVEQIRLIGRYTRNITVLYDGDPAGIKASLRGIDLILEEGMNVRVVLFPDGDDPDSFSKRVDQVELKRFLDAEAVDFISFKTRLLLGDAAGDPIKRAALIRDIVSTIAKVPDAITRASYIRHTAVLMEMAENVLLGELNKLLRSKATSRPTDPGAVPGPSQDGVESGGPEDPGAEEQTVDEFDAITQEEEIIRILLLYADHEIMVPDAETDRTDGPQVRIRDFIVSELRFDDIRFMNPVYAGILAEFAALSDNALGYDQQRFLQVLDPEIRQTAISLMTPTHQLADWSRHKIDVKTEEQQLHKAVIDPVAYIKKKQIIRIKANKFLELKTLSEAGISSDHLLEELRELNNLQMYYNRLTNTVIQK